MASLRKWFRRLRTLLWTALAMLIILGVVVYFGLAHLTGALRLNEVRASLRR